MSHQGDIVRTFYQAMKDGEAEKMVSLYGEEAIFSDPAFGPLNAQQVKDMWRMLLGRSRDLKVDFKVLEEDGDCVITALDAKYTFGLTGKKVHNRIRSTIWIRDGKIIKHQDQFDLYTWARQAFGLSGWLIGWTGYFRRKLQRGTNRLLNKFQNENKEG